MRVHVVYLLFIDPIFRIIFQMLFSVSITLQKPDCLFYTNAPIFAP